MKTIWKIFTGDLKRIQKNAIAWIVILGLSVVPSLYAWFNIAASWDPYSNTGSLKVAVANTDKGYEGDLLPLNINMGEQVISGLRENNQLKWVFTTKKKAVEGVKSGKYYAAIVIPESFSSDMMSLFSEDVKHSDILYYLNEKENAIAPKVTDKGAGAVQKQIDELFTKTISEVGLELMDGLSSMMTQEDSKEAISRVNENIGQIADDLSAAAGTVKAFSNMTGSMQQMMESTAAFLNQTGNSTETNASLLTDTGNSVSSLKDALSGTTEGINQVLMQGSSVYSAVSDQVDQTFTSLSGDASAAEQSLNGLAGEVQTIIDRYTAFRDSLQQISDALPESLQLIKEQLGSVIGKLNTSIAQQEGVRDKLNEAADKISQSVQDAGTYQSELKALAEQSAGQISSVQADYEQNVKGKLDELFGTLGNTNDAVSSILARLNESTQGIENLSGSAASDLGKLKTALDTSVSLLEESSAKISEVRQKLESAAQDGDFQTLKDVLTNSPDVVSEFIAAPVKMETKDLYPVENYGSAMAPFYSTLSIWVGGIILVAMMKVTLSEERKKELGNVKNYQIYLGRYLLFLIMGLIQSGLICLGDLFFLGIQCEHPFLFLLTGWITSIVYVNIIYTLTVSFGDVGKAVCVVLLVMQVAGSGGTFPIEMTPEFFQKVYPLLPFTHSMGAMRETIAGMYGNTYLTELGKLGVFLAASLCLGLVLRKPVIRLNELIIEKLEETKLM